MSVICPNKVVLDGEMNLILALDGDCNLNVPESGEFGVITVIKDYEAPIYDGDYIVTPRAWEQYLDTDHKVLINDVTVLEIPYTEVGNLAGGTTVSIG